MARKVPSTMRSVFHKLKVFNTDDAQLNMDRAVNAAGEISQASEAAKRYRTAVLADSELSERLRRTLGYTNADRWTGHVPNHMNPDGKTNTDPQRAALIDIVTEALNRADDHEEYDTRRLEPVPREQLRDPFTGTWAGPSYAQQEARIQQILSEATA